MTWRVLPDCSAYLIEHWYAHGIIQRFVVGPRSVYADIDQTGRLGTRVTPLALGALPFPASELTDTAIAASDIMSRAARAYTVPALVRAALALASSVRTVECLAGRLGVSARYLRAVFDEHVGLTPKRALRIVRFRAVFEASKAAPHVGWAALAAAYGYGDQSHLIDEFHALVGESPEAFRERCTHEARHAVPLLPSAGAVLGL